MRPHFQRKGAKAQSVGRARSPLRAGVGSVLTWLLGLESYRPRPHGRGYGLLVRWWMKHPVDPGCGGQKTARPTKTVVLAQ